MSFDSTRTEKILACYESFQIDWMTISIGWDGSTASQVIPLPSPQIDADHLLDAGAANFTNNNSTVRMSATSPAYNFMVAPAGTNTPLHHIFGAPGNVAQYIYWTEPYWLARQGGLTIMFTNSAATLTTGGSVTIVCRKLINRIPGTKLPWER